MMSLATDGCSIRENRRSTVGPDPMTDRLKVAIVGAGIGGLAAALALSARGIAVAVFEEADSAREAGAGISIPPNAAILL